MCRCTGIPRATPTQQAAGQDVYINVCNVNWRRWTDSVPHEDVRLTTGGPQMAMQYVTKTINTSCHRLYLRRVVLETAVLLH